MPSACGVPHCPNRCLTAAMVKFKNVQFHRLPGEERLRAEWCRRIDREDPGQAGVRVCSEHFDGDREYRRIGSVLRDAGQTVKRALLKSDAVPSLRLPPTVKRNIPSMEDPTSKRRKLVDDDPIEELGFEGNAPCEHDCHCRHRPTTSDAAVQADPQEKPQVPTPAVLKDSSVGTDPRLGKRSVGTQANSYARGVTSHHVQTEALELPGSCSATASIGTTTTAAVSASFPTTTTATTPAPQVPPQGTVLAPATSPVPSHSHEEEEDDDERKRRRKRRTTTTPCMSHSAKMALSSVDGRAGQAVGGAPRPAP
ncbi:LOW QUALITY PROTEIN: translation initiation factor IF-2-like [Ixodes scapularis]|uniref:LOW QUALITY PROTEIN: translation initiation factor IF-2-like n=1 Tax=Ixodes scapularis TaxID=6945 RepID=UPI001A9D4C42|nr:LOW QUALITY PROTEIN: translation initiation factor IF-2-like [Ixodes scapularis]